VTRQNLHPHEPRIALAIALSICASPVRAEKIALINGTLIDPATSQIVQDAMIIIKGDKSLQPAMPGRSALRKTPASSIAKANSSCPATSTRICISFSRAISIHESGYFADLVILNSNPLLSQILTPLHFPIDLLPLALMRPLSGSATLALLTDIVHRLGPDNIVSLTAATIYGSTETTFYVAAVYFGAVGIKQARHAIPARLLADLTGIVASVIICRAAVKLGVRSYGRHSDHIQHDNQPHISARPAVAPYP
jgi:spore maturation protein SpmB